MAKSIEDLEEDMEEMELRFETKFEALKTFTIQKIKEMNVGDALIDMNESIGSMKEDILSIKTDSLKRDSSQSEDVSVIMEAGEAIKRPFKGFSFSPLSSTTPVKVQPDRALLDKVKKYYTEEKCGKMDPMHYAYFLWYFIEIKGGNYSGRKSVIDDLIKRGVKDGMWEGGYCPAGLKNSFFEYLRDKAKNHQKKKLSDEALDKFVKDLQG